MTFCRVTNTNLQERSTLYPFKQKGASQCGPRLSFFNRPGYLLHPPQSPEAQQSAEAQHECVAAFTAPASPSASTANKTIVLIFFMDFSPLKNQAGFCGLTQKASARYRAILGGLIFLDPQQPSFEERVSSGMPDGGNEFDRAVKLRRQQNQACGQHET